MAQPASYHSDNSTQSLDSKLEHPTITLHPEAVHQLQNLLSIGSALAAHAQRYSRSQVLRDELAPAWSKQLAHVKSWLEGCPNARWETNQD